MSIAEFAKQSKKQLEKCRFRVSILLITLIFSKLFFVFLRVICADFMNYAKVANGFDFAFSTDLRVIIARAIISLLEFLVLYVLLSKLVLLCTLKEQTFKQVARLFAGFAFLKSVLFVAKLPFLICSYLSFAFFRKILYEYNSQSLELLIAVFMGLSALCFVLLYIYFALGLFAFPYLVANGESFVLSFYRSILLMQKKRGRLLIFALSCLPEAILIFRLPNVAMRFAVFAKYCVRDSNDDLNVLYA